MRVPGATGHQQYRFVFQFAEGTGHIQRVGHHHQTGLMTQLRDHRSGGAATVDNDPCVFANATDSGFGDGLLIKGDRLALISKQFLRQSYRTAIATQQQAVGFKGSQILADGDFRGFETLGQSVDAHLALPIEQSQDVMTTLGSVTFRHGALSFVSKDNDANQNL
ncbi:hypothetical protein D3C81_1292450 [compost metagenome]